MKLKSLSIWALAAAFVVCAFAPRPAEASSIVLGAGESIYVEHHAMWLGFTGIVSESRCPLGVLCFWEGDAAVSVWAGNTPDDRREFVLHTHHGFPWQAQYGSNRISLLLVEPYPVIEHGTDPSQYRVTLSIEETLGTEPTTWGAIKSLYRD